MQTVVLLLAPLRWALPSSDCPAARPSTSPTATGWRATHSSGILTVGTGDLRVTTAGTDAASVVTAGGTEELDNKTLDSSVGKGTWTASGTWTLPALTLGGTVSGGGNQLNNVIIGASTPLAGSFTTANATTWARVGSASAPANTTAGDITGVRLSLGNGALAADAVSTLDITHTSTETSGASLLTYKASPIRLPQAAIARRNGVFCKCGTTSARSRHQFRLSDSSRMVRHPGCECRNGCHHNRDICERIDGICDCRLAGNDSKGRRRSVPVARFLLQRIDLHHHDSRGRASQ